MMLLFVYYKPNYQKLWFLATKTYTFKLQSQMETKGEQKHLGSCESTSILLSDSC